MGSNFNLGSIPEDISGLESMDTGDLDTTLTGESTPTANPAGGGPHSDDHLMTTLPLGDDISNDIMETLLNSSRAGGQQASAPSASASAPVTTSSVVPDTLTWL